LLYIIVLKYIFQKDWCSERIARGHVARGNMHVATWRVAHYNLQ